MVGGGAFEIVRRAIEAAAKHSPLRGRETLLATAIYALLGAIQAWPVTLHPSSRLWGDSGDAWQNLWNGWWLTEALSRGHSPFAGDLLWHPDGVDLWLHTLGPLNAALTALGQAVLPGFAGFNLGVFAQLIFGAVASFLLARHLVSRIWPELGRWPVFTAAIVGGLVFGFSPYVWGHSAVHLHLQSVGVLVLFVLSMERALTGERWGVPGMVLSGLATALVGWYLLLDEVFLGVVFVGVAALRLGKEGRGPLVRLLAGGALTGVVVAPLLYQVMAAGSVPLEGVHDPRVFALDLLSPFVPSASQAIGGPFLGLTRRFSGNAAENATYLGWGALLLAGLAAYRLRGRLPLRYGVAGCLGLALATGPDLRLGGVAHADWGIFYRALEVILPPVQGLGCPVRFALLTNLSVGMLAALGFAALAAWIGSRGLGGRLGLGAVVVLVVVELWPSPVPTSLYPRPDFLVALSEEAGGGAGIDLTGWTHPLYNQTLHGRPIVHGYTSRRPLALVRKLESDPVLGPLFAEGLHLRAPRRQALQRIETTVGGDWGTGSPATEVARDFEARFVGTLLLPTSGAWTFLLGSDDGAQLMIDGKRIVDNGGLHPYQEREATVPLEAGEHSLLLTFRDAGGAARLSLLLEGPELPRAPPSPEMLRAPGGEPGLQVTYHHRAARAGLEGAAAWRHLRERWGVDFLIAYEDRVPWMVEGQLGLTEVARGGGLVLYSVPTVP